MSTPAPGPREAAPPPAGRTAVLLVNLGTPEAPDPASVRRYLAQFLADRRVIELPRVLWLPILYGLILPLRSRRSAHAYRAIWTPQGSPLRVLSEHLAEAVAQQLGPAVTVRLAMRYGQPAIAEVLEQLRRDGMRRLLLLPLYPQYSATSTASVFDEVTRVLRGWRWLPELRCLQDYATEPAWLDAVAESIRAWWDRHGRGDRLLLSFHGVPQRYVAAGDPYEAQCRASAAAIAERLALPPQAWEFAFQSRVGREPWLAPYTEDRVRALGRDGLRTLDVACPGFAVDCLETLEEIAQRNAADFVAAGGGTLRYVPALNASPAHARALAGLVRRNAAGWPGLGLDGASA